MSLWENPPIPGGEGSSELFFFISIYISIYISSHKRQLLRLLSIQGLHGLEFQDEHQQKAAHNPLQPHATHTHTKPQTGYVFSTGFCKRFLPTSEMVHVSPCAENVLRTEIDTPQEMAKNQHSASFSSHGDLPFDQWAFGHRRKTGKLPQEGLMKL